MRAALEKLLASPGFAGSERLSRFLRYVVEETLEGRSEGLKEITVGVDVFGRKPGYDPCELFFDPQRLWPKVRAFGKLALKKLSLRTLIDVIPLDASVVKGSHGLCVADPLDKPVFVGSGDAPTAGIVHQTEIRNHILRHFGIDFV